MCDNLYIHVINCVSQEQDYHNEPSQQTNHSKGKFVQLNSTTKNRKIYKCHLSCILKFTRYCTVTILKNLKICINN